MRPLTGKFMNQTRGTMKALFFSLCMVTSLSLMAQDLAIIPEPVSLKRGQGRFTLEKELEVEAPNRPEVQYVLNYLKDRMGRSTGVRFDIEERESNPDIRLQLLSSRDTTLGKEGYRLSVTTQRVTLQANEAAGLFYGVQTLLQLFPKEIESKTPVPGVEWTAPVVEITDYPRFGWRGLMFDVSRHFFTKEEVKRYIDNMVRYKYNILHLHLTDDEGWRIEIKSLPKLTEVGAWRVNKTGYFGTFAPPGANEPKDYGGFYTHEDIKELVQYARERFVNILPEIDMPGHSLATIASYPELSCTPGADKYRVRSGEKIMEWPAGGHFYALVDNTLCPANEKVYEFVDKVVTEVAQLFPFEYLHLGGDEAATNFWDKSPQIKALMQKEGLKNMMQVQGYFEKRVEQIVTSKGKKFIGWDEILEGGLPPSAAVMSWRGLKGGIEAAKQGHEVVMSPTTYAYIDYMQGDPIIEPRVYASLRLNKSYEFDPLPEGVNPKLIKGGQANLWTEQVYNMRHAEYMTWPRGFAIAESVWSPKEKKNWRTFFPKVEEHFKRFDVAQVKYAPSVYDPIFTAKRVKDTTISIELATEVEGLDIHYTFDNSFPDNYYPKYTAPLTPPSDAVALRVITYRNGKPAGRLITMPLEEMRKRAGIKK
jgi:hexosaminidase